jgi:CubicO group peptidase (beta-lactamase class C family)
VYTLIQHERPEASPGQQVLYSDLDFMLLGAVIEKLSGMELDQYCLDNIFRPLGLQQTAFINLGKRRQGALPFPLGQVAPTERCPWRNRILCAEVHDDNAYAMGGVAGHAGLFSAIDDLNQLVNCLLACYRGEHCFLPSALLREFWTRDETVSGSTWALGWDTPSLSHSSAGELFSAHSVGHLGFTGTSLWIDLERQLYVIILSNRVHPRRDNDKIKTFRPVLHNTIMRIVLGRK